MIVYTAQCYLPIPLIIVFSPLPCLLFCSIVYGMKSLNLLNTAKQTNQTISLYFALSDFNTWIENVIFFHA